ncbi:MAG: DUF362 domain-containing protein [candidate division KSB1 bacterium]|nr:DUF362 domain-containing protein [candidate division KSB1 bacterium]
MSEAARRDQPDGGISRRTFLRWVGLAGAGMVVGRSWASGSTVAERAGTRGGATLVAVTEVSTYERALIRQKVQHLFESLGGISDLVGPGTKVAIKLNLTGGSGTAYHFRLGGKDIRDTMWTHPEVLRAVGELLIDCGVRPSDLYIVEALWDRASYYNFGYRDVQTSLGAQFVDLNAAPFVQASVGEPHFRYESFVLNRILQEVHVYVSIPKLKHHYEAGITGALKNQIGITPLSYYKRSSSDGNRSKLHYGQEGENVGTHLPRAICDLNLVRPVHLAVIDGVKNALGGEGAWNPTFVPAESHVLLAGKDPIATDAIAALLLGLNPEEETLPLPDGVRRCDNHLDLLRQCGKGTNRLSEIQVVGDGAGRVTGVWHGQEKGLAERPRILWSYPNPFNAVTRVHFEVPAAGWVELETFDAVGRRVGRLYKGWVPAGEHQVSWDARGLPSGVYFCRLQYGRTYHTTRLVLER